MPDHLDRSYSPGPLNDPLFSFMKPSWGFLTLIQEEQHHFPFSSVHLISALVTQLGHLQILSPGLSSLICEHLHRMIGMDLFSSDVLILQ